MGREIKFRVWDNEEKTMEIVGAIDWVETKGVLEPITVNTRTKKLYQIHPGVSDFGFVLMQFTGLKDKDGKEIYEGDILKMNNDNYDPEYESFFVGTCEVEWKGIGFGFKVIENCMKNSFAMDSSAMWHVGEGDTTEVIGNIHENPELLNV